MERITYCGHIIICLLVSVNSIAISQADECNATVKLSAQKKPIAVYNLIKPYPTYTKKQFVGKIVKVQYNTDGISIVGFILEQENGIRQEIDVTHDECIPHMNKIYRDWIPYIIRRGNQVRIDALLSGSAGVINAKNITIIKSSK